MNRLRHHRGYYAFLGHRLSGLALALFLPVHFLTLGLALEDAAALDAALVYSALPAVKAAEWGLVCLLALHFFFGLRILALEFGRWPARTDPFLAWVLPGTAASLFVGAVFLFQVSSW